MYLILTASKDAYITDKIIDNSYRVTDTNTGFAATLDLFKLWNESSDIEDGTAVEIGGVTGPIELSRALIKFDFDTIQSFVDDAKLDISDPTFECKLQMKDILAGQAVPMNFNLILFPLAQSFDEGYGSDVSGYGDISVVNWVTASYSGGANNLWNAAGAGATGFLNDPSIDIIEFGDLEDGAGASSQMYTTQQFVNGSENLVMDVTRIVSASLAGQITDNHGFLLAFSGSEETDDASRFVKRFASRHVRDPYLRPQMLVSWDDSIVDNHKNFFFDLTGSLFLQNYHYGVPADLVDPTTATGITGPDCMDLFIVSDQFSKNVEVSQYKIGDSWVTGLYTGSFAIASIAADSVNAEDTIADFVLASGSITFEEYWGTSGGSFGFHTGSLKINTIPRSVFTATRRRLDLITTNVKKTYKLSDKVKFRVFIRDLDEERTSVKLPIQLDSKVLNSVYYRVRDAVTGKVTIPFKTNNDGTKLSADSDGMFFELYMNNLPPGRVYTLDYLVTDEGIEFVMEDGGIQFRVDA